LMKKDSGIWVAVEDGMYTGVSVAGGCNVGETAGEGDGVGLSTCISSVIRVGIPGRLSAKSFSTLHPAERIDTANETTRTKPGLSFMIWKGM